MGVRRNCRGLLKALQDFQEQGREWEIPSIYGIEQACRAQRNTIVDGGYRTFASSKVVLSVCRVTFEAALSRPRTHQHNISTNIHVT